LASSLQLIDDVGTRLVAISGILVGFACSLVGSIARAESFAQKVKVQRERLERHVNVSEIAQQGLRTMPLFQSFVEQHGASSASRAGGMMLVTGTEKHGLWADTSGTLQMSRDGGNVRATAADLLRLGVGSGPALHAAMAKRIGELRGKPQQDLVDLPIRGDVYSWWTGASGLARPVTARRLRLLANLAWPSAAELPTSAGSFYFSNGTSTPRFRRTSIAQEKDFAAAGIKTWSDLDVVIAHRIIELAGTKGSASDPAAVDEAERALEQQMNARSTLHDVYWRPHLHAELDLLLRAHLSLSLRDHASRSLVLQSNEFGRLVPGDLWTKWNGDRNPLHLGGINTNQPTDAHFARIGLGSPQQLTEAIEHRMLEIAIEDLDLPPRP
jgi:hypothetical protein